MSKKSSCGNHLPIERATFNSGGYLSNKSIAQPSIDDLESANGLTFSFRLFSFFCLGIRLKTALFIVTKIYSNRSGY
jgi:hypothetical protein